MTVYHHQKTSLTNHTLQAAAIGWRRLGSNSFERSHSFPEGHLGGGDHGGRGWIWRGWRGFQVKEAGRWCCSCCRSRSCCCSSSGSLLSAISVSTLMAVGGGSAVGRVACATSGYHWTHDLGASGMGNGRTKGFLFRWWIGLCRTRMRHEWVLYDLFNVAVLQWDDGWGLG